MQAGARHGFDCIRFLIICWSAPHALSYLKPTNWRFRCSNQQRTPLRTLASARWRHSLGAREKTRDHGAGNISNAHDGNLGVVRSIFSLAAAAAIDTKSQNAAGRDLQSELVDSFFLLKASRERRGANVHLKTIYGRSNYHKVLQVFQGIFARCLRVACSRDKELASGRYEGGFYYCACRYGAGKSAQSAEAFAEGIEGDLLIRQSSPSAGSLSQEWATSKRCQSLNQNSAGASTRTPLAPANHNFLELQLMRTGCSKAARKLRNPLGATFAGEAPPRSLPPAKKSLCRLGTGSRLAKGIWRLLKTISSGALSHSTPSLPCGA